MRLDKKLLAGLKEHPTPEHGLPVEYIITSSIEIIDNQQILHLSFFGQRKAKVKADFKVFFCGKEYISQKLQDNGEYKWSNACIANLIGYWSYYHLHTPDCYTTEEKERIFKYLGIRGKSVWDALGEFQRRIMSERLNLRYEKETKLIDEAMDKVAELPKDFRQWVNNGPFAFSRYIYYKREGKRIRCFCTECKSEFTVLETKSTKKNIKHDHHGTCPKCNKKIVYKAEGKTKRLYDTAQFAIVQRYEEGLIIRYFMGSKSYKDHYRKPRLSYYENIREIYSVNDKGLIFKRFEFEDFHQTGRHRWCNDGGKIGTPKAYLYTQNLRRVIKGTRWQYSGLFEYAKASKVLYVDTLLKEYVSYPGIEYLIKLKLYKFVDDKLNFRHPYWGDINFNGKNIKEVMGLNKTQLQQMQRLNLGASGLKFIKACNEVGKSLTDEQIKWVLKNVDTERFVNMLGLSTPEKTINYIKKQSGRDYETKNVLIDWYDYTLQCKALKFDLNNSFVLYPQDLKGKHEEYTILNKAKGLEKYESKISKAYEEINELYSYQDKNYLIRPARSVSEIIEEGHKQRHCVGGEGYVRRTAEGHISIMLLRKIEEPDKSFYTLELNLDNLSVVQCRGYKNCDVSDEVKKFLDKWKLQKLKAKTRKKAV